MASPDFKKVFTASSDDYPIDQFAVSSTTEQLSSDQEDVPEDMVEMYTGLFSDPIHVMMASVIVKKIIRDGAYAILSLNTANEGYFVEIFREDFSDP